VGALCDTSNDDGGGGGGSCGAAVMVLSDHIIVQVPTACRHITEAANLIPSTVNRSGAIKFITRISRTIGVIYAILPCELDGAAYRPKCQKKITR